MRTLLLLSMCILYSVIACKQPEVSKKIAVSRNGVSIAYNECGKGDTTLLFLHGWVINKSYWDKQLEYFCSKYKVVAIDLPGFGESGKSRQNWGFDEYTEDVKAVIDQLQLKHVILIGHSMSGDIVLNTDNKYPSLLAGIVGIDNLHEPGSPMDEKAQKQTDTLFQMLSLHFDSTVSQVFKAPLFPPATDTSIINRVMNDAFHSDSTVAIKVMKSLMGIAQTEQSLMKGLSHKLYLVNSDVVPVKSDSLNKYCNKGFQVELVYNTSHYPMIEKPEAFNIALQKVIYSIGTNKAQ